MNKEYELFIRPSDAEPYMRVDAVEISRPLSGQEPKTIDVVDRGPWGEVILRFRPTAPRSLKCYLIAMSSEFNDGFLSRFSRSL